MQIEEFFLRILSSVIFAARLKWTTKKSPEYVHWIECMNNVHDSTFIYGFYRSAIDYPVTFLSPSFNELQCKDDLSS